MSLKNTAEHYGSVAKFLHWFLAICIVAMLLIGFFYTDFGSQATQLAWLRFHKSLGMLILALMIIRIIWQFINITPSSLLPIPRWQHLLSQLHHWLLYIALILMPISGWIMSIAGGHTPIVFGLFTANAPIPVNKTLASTTLTCHVILAWVIIALVAMHILAVLKHWLIDKDNVLQRML